MKPKFNKKKIIKTILQVVIYSSVLLFMYFTLKDNLESVKHYKIDNIWLLVLSVPVFGISIFINSLAWHLMMKFSDKKIPIEKSIDTYISSYIVRYIPGNVWAIAARAYNNKENGVKMIKSMWGWFIENLSYLTVGMIFSLLVISRFLAGKSQYFWLILIMIPVALFVVLRYEIFTDFFEKVIKKKLPEKIRKETGFLDLSTKQRVVLLLIYSISWIFYSINFLMVSHAVVGIELSQVPVLVGANALAWSIGYMSIVTPSGAGVRESILMLILNGQIGIPKLDTVVITILARVTFIFGDLFIFAVFKLYKIIFMKNGEEKIPKK